MPTPYLSLQKLISYVQSFGRDYLHLQFPLDIEAYYLILELVDGAGQTIRNLVFPVLPYNMAEEHKEVTKVNQNAVGTHVLKTSSFTPRTLMFKGMFGRQFYIIDFGQSTGNPLANGLGGGLASGDTTSFASGSFGRAASAKQRVVEKKEFSRIFKTGNGVVQLLKKMKEDSKQRDAQGRPTRLFLYNPVLGENYVVEFMDFRQDMDRKTSNMLASYYFEFKTAATLEDVINGQLFGEGFAARFNRGARATALRVANRVLNDPVGSVRRTATEGVNLTSRLI